MSDVSEMDAGGMALELWLYKVGRDRSTGHRWMELGMISTLNIMGRHYMTKEEISRFWTRAAAGEFAKIPGGVCKPDPKK